jgi:hypothetical protein
MGRVLRTEETQFGIALLDADQGPFNVEFWPLQPGSRPDSRLSYVHRPGLLSNPLSSPDSMRQSRVQPH